MPCGYYKLLVLITIINQLTFLSHWHYTVLALEGEPRQSWFYMCEHVLLHNKHSIPIYYCRCYLSNGCITRGN